MVEVVLAVGTMVAAAAAVTLWSAFHRVPQGEIELLLVRGEAREILEPGIYVVPPFVSTTFPVDLRTMRYDAPDGRRPIPSTVREDAERIAAAREHATDAGA